MAAGVAVALTALLLAGILGVPYRAMQAPEQRDQPWVHFKIKNTTRLGGADAPAIATSVARAVYPATEPANTPDIVILYDPADWRGGLAAASLLKPLNGVLLPASAADEIDRLKPRGSPAAGGAAVLRIGSGGAPSGAGVRALRPADVAELLARAGAPPRHVLVVDPNDPATALLAAPWAAYSGDLVVFDADAAPAGLPRYALGNAPAGGVTRIGGTDPVSAALTFAKYGDPADPTFGWGMDDRSLSGYHAWTLARRDDPATALLSANLARRGKPGPLLWTEQRELPQAVNDYLWSQRPAFWVAPNEGPFDHVWVLGDPDRIGFPAQAQADYALEIGPYRMKGPGLAGMDMLAAAWIALGAASALWFAFHAARFLPQLHWTMKLAWPLLALMVGPFGILLYALAYRRPVLHHGQMTLWDRPLWLQGLAATAGSVAFGGLLMVATGYVMTLVGLPLVPNDVPAVFGLGSPMVLVMAASYGVAVAVSWLLFQTPMLGMFHGLSYHRALWVALPIVLISMASVSLAMFPGMWRLMMWNLPMMPTEESILWFGVMFFTVLMGLLASWPFNYALVRSHHKSGLM